MVINLHQRATLDLVINDGLGKLGASARDISFAAWV